MIRSNLRDRLSTETSAPDSTAAPAEDTVATTAFTVEPEGSELALVLDDRVEVLATLDPEGGPGTGRPADDNGAFGLEGAPSVLQARSWEVMGADGSQTTIRAEDVDGAAIQIHVERQGDGALAVRQTTGG